MTHFVFDACTILALLSQEPGSQIAANFLIDPNARCSVHAINLCEVFYDTLRASDEATALQAVEDVQALGLIVSRS